MFESLFQPQRMLKLQKVEIDRLRIINAEQDESIKNQGAKIDRLEFELATAERDFKQQEEAQLHHFKIHKDLETRRAETEIANYKKAVTEQLTPDVTAFLTQMDGNLSKVVSYLAAVVKFVDQNEVVRKEEGA